MYKYYGRFSLFMLVEFLWFNYLQSLHWAVKGETSLLYKQTCKLPWEHVTWKRHNAHLFE